MQTVEDYLPNTTKGIEHKLNTAWIVYMRYNYNTNWDIHQPIPLYRFSTIGGFWFISQILEKYMQSGRTYFIMREGTSPKWEDDVHIDSSYCIVECNNETYQNIFLKCTLVLVAETICSEPEKVSGLSFNFEHSYKIIKFWVSKIVLNKNNISNEIINIAYDPTNLIGRNSKTDIIRSASFKDKVNPKYKQNKLITYETYQDASSMNTSVENNYNYALSDSISFGYDYN
jgi:hypothetical protein